MPSVSKKQQRFFGLVRAVQQGEMPESKVSAGLAKTARSINEQDASDFAKKLSKRRVK